MSSKELPRSFPDAAMPSNSSAPKVEPTRGSWVLKRRTKQKKPGTLHTNQLKNSLGGEVSMGKKRKQDQGRNGETSKPNGGMPPPEGFSDIVHALIELKGEVNASAMNTIKRTFKMLEKKRKEDEEKQKKDLQVAKEELRILKEDHEKLKLQIEEMRKEGFAEVNHYKASPSQRSQPSQPTRFQLVIENSVSSTVYKKEPVETKDGGGHIKVVMYDGGNPIASDHPLASVSVDLVLIEGRFNEPKQDSWSKEEFQESIIKPRKGITNLVKNGTLNLIGGRCDHEGAIIMDNSQRREVKLGVMIAVHTEVRVLEGVSNPFKVQEGKTRKTAPNKKAKRTSPPVPTRNLVHTTSTHATQHGQGRISPDAQHSFPPHVIQDVLQNTGQVLNGNGQQSCQQITLPFWQPIRTHSVQQDDNTLYPPPGDFPANHNLLTFEQDQYNNFLAYLSNHSLNNIPQWNSIPRGEIFAEDVYHSNVQPPVEEYYGPPSRCGQVLLQWDEPLVEVKKHILPSPIEPYDSDDEPPVKKKRNSKYQLRFVNRVCNDYYTREQIKSEDGNLLKVALYDENNLVVTSGPLSSASVEVVLLHGDFNAHGQDYWTSQEFSSCLVHSQSVKEQPALGGDRVLALTDGEAELGNAYFQSSSFHARTGKFKMGVEIKSAREESVQEGITSPFLVRVRQGEESSCCHQTKSFKLLGVGIELGEQVCGALECDARENVGASWVLHDQSLQVGTVLEACRAEDPESMVRTASDRPPEPSRQGVEWSAPSTPKPKAYKHDVVMREKSDSSDFDPIFTDRSCITDSTASSIGASQGCRPWSMAAE